VITLNPAERNARPVSGVAVTSSSVDKITFDVTLNAVEIGSEGSADVIKFEGSTPSSEVGAPSLPVIRRAFAVPQCESVEIEVKVGAETLVKDVKLGVVPEYVGKETQREVALNSRYQAGVSYPQSGGRVANVGLMRGQQIVIVELYPVHYNAMAREARVASSLAVTLTPVRPTGPLFVNGGPMQDVLDVVLTNSSGYDKSLTIKDPHRTGGPGTVNWCTGASISAVADSVSDCAADYLIIAAQELTTTNARRDLITDIANRRATYNGFNVAIVAMQFIDASVTSTPADTPTKIRDLIQQVYESESAAHMGDQKLGYVLLLGDARNPNGDWLIPGNNVTGSESREEGNDALYANMDDPADTDKFPDLLLGRLPVDADGTNWELTNVRSKIETYEPLPDSAWVDKAIWIGGGQAEDWENEWGAGNPFEAIFDAYDEQFVPASTAVTQLHALDHSSSYDYTFSTNAVNALESGVRTALIFGHGYYWYLGGHPGNGCFQPADYDFLDVVSPRKPPVFFALASHLGHFDNTTSSASSPSTDLDPYDVLCERLVLQSSGAIATVGYCRTSFVPLETRDEAHLLRAVHQYQEPDLGRIVAVAKVLGAVAESGGEIYSRRITLFGDPAINIQWQEQAHDDIDLAVTSLDIVGASPLANGNLTEDGTLNISIHNHGGDSAEDFVVKTWNGDPSNGGTLIDSSFVAVLGGHAKTVVSVPYNFDRGSHTIHVVVDPDSLFNEPVRDNNDANRVFDALDEKNGFPINVFANGGWSTVVADIAASSGKEILVRTGNGIRCIPASGASAIWNAVSSTPSSILVASFDMNGRPNVIKEHFPGGACPPCTFYAYALDGENGAVIDSFAVGDAIVNNPSKMQNILTGAQNCWAGDLVGGNNALEFIGIKGKGIITYSRHGSTVWERTLGSPDAAECSIAIGDIDYDGDVEVALARWDSLAVFNGANGQSLWRRQLVDDTGFISSSYVPRVALADLDGNGSVEIITSGVSSTGDAKVMTWSNSGSQLNTVAVGDFVPAGNTALAAADIDGSSGIEIVSVIDTTVSVYSSSLALQDSYHPAEGTHLFPTVLLADTDNDGDSEVICMATSQDFGDVAWTRRNTTELLKLSYTLTLEDSFVVSRTATSSQPSYPAVADVDEDGKLEVVLVSNDGFLHAIELGTAAGSVPWGMNHGDAMATRLVEQPIRGTYTKPLSLFNRCRVLDDATFQDDLFIDGSADIVVNATSLTSGGTYSTKCDVVAQDGVKVQGWTTRDASIKSSSGAMSSWGGLTIAADSEPATMRKFSVRDAASGVTTSRDVRLSFATITNCSVGFNAVDDSTIIDHSTFTYNTIGASVGDDFLKLRQSTANNNSFADVAVGVGADAQIDTCSFGTSPTGLYVSGTAVAKKCLFAANPVGVLYTGTGAAGTIKYSTFTSCPIGVQTTTLNTSTPVMVRNNTISSSSTAGVKVVGTNGAVTLRNNNIGSSAVGVLADGSDAEVRFGNNIHNNTIGVKCINSAVAVVESTQVVSNTTGIEVSSNSNCDIGHSSGGSSTGINSIHDSAPYNVKNLNTGITVMAENNWFGVDPPRNTGFNGSVDRNPWLIEDPELFFLFKPEVPKQQLPETFALGNAMPNPFNPETTIPYDVPAGGGLVAINVYDVAGRKVATLMNEHSAAGRHMVRWQGRDSRGASVASGIYFVQMKSPGLVMTKKIVLLK
jgi:flagellar hook assembly protein FlgD